MALVGAASLLLILVAGTVPPGHAADPARLVGAERLQPFFTSLVAIEQKRARGPVRILQIGDSHTANDSFSGRLRERLAGCYA